MLFDINAERKKPLQPNTLLIKKVETNFFSQQEEFLRKYLHNVDYSKTNQFWSNGKFALHDLIIYFARLHSPAHVFVSSFNLSVEAANKFLNASDKGYFKSLKLLLNSQKKNNYLKAVKLLEGKFPMGFSQIHAKVALIWNDSIKIGIVTTGNLSSNGNLERGFIYFDKKTFEFDKSVMEFRYDNAISHH